jgi:hypothetical protein
MSDERVTIEIGIVEMDGHDRPIIYVPDTYLRASKPVPEADLLARWFVAINSPTNHLGVRISSPGDREAS